MRQLRRALASRPSRGRLLVVAAVLAASSAAVVAVLGTDSGSRRVPEGATREASCAGPTLEASPNQAGAGSTVEVVGSFFTEDCSDTVVNGIRSPQVPMTGLRLALRQGAREWLLTDQVAPAGELSRFREVVRLPDDVEPGTAVVAVPGTSTTVTMQVREPLSSP